MAKGALSNVDKRKLSPFTAEVWCAMFEVLERYDDSIIDWERSAIRVIEDASGDWEYPYFVLCDFHSARQDELELRVNVGPAPDSVQISFHLTEAPQKKLRIANLELDEDDIGAFKTRVMLVLQAC